MAAPKLKSYTTKVPVERTVQQIMSLLAKHGAQRIMQDFEDGSVVGMIWSVDLPQGQVAFKMPVNVDKCHAVLQSQGVSRGYEHSRRVAWRLVLNWIEVQIALLQTEMVTFDQVMLPYAVGRDGRTLYEHMLEGGYQQYAALPPGPSQ